MINVRVTGDEEEVTIFMNFLKRIAESQGGYEITSFRTPQKGNNPKYKNSNNVLSYMNLKSIVEVVNHE